MYCSLIYLSAWWLTDLGKGHIWHYFRNSYVLDYGLLQINANSVWQLSPQPQVCLWTPLHGASPQTISVGLCSRSHHGASVTVIADLWLHPWCQQVADLSRPHPSRWCAIDFVSFHQNPLHCFIGILGSLPCITYDQNHTVRIQLNLVYGCLSSYLFQICSTFSVFFLASPLLHIFAVVSVCHFSTHNWIKIVASCCYSSHF